MKEKIDLEWYRIFILNELRDFETTNCDERNDAYLFVCRAVEDLDVTDEIKVDLNEILQDTETFVYDKYLKMLVVINKVQQKEIKENI